MNDKWKIDSYDNDYHINNAWKELLEEKLKSSDDGESVDFELFLKIIDAVSRGETPEWLTLRGNRNDKEAAETWIRAIKTLEKRKKAEEERLRREAVKKAALDKLTAEEKKVLGLK